MNIGSSQVQPRRKEQQNEIANINIVKILTFQNFVDYKIRVSDFYRVCNTKKLLLISVLDKQEFRKKCIIL